MSNPRCKVCKNRFPSKYFNQKTCSKECKDIYDADNPKKEIKARSDKRNKEEAIYYAKKIVHMTANPICECDCEKKSEDLHHKNGRVGKMIYNVFYFMSVCRDCHNWIHSNPKEARIKGWLV